MRKKTEQTIDLMNERLRKLESNNNLLDKIGGTFARSIAEIEKENAAFKREIAALKDEIDALKVIDAAPEEPPVGSIIRDCDGYAWQRTPSGWWPISDPFTYCDGAKDWAHVQMYYGPTTLLYFNVDQELDWINPKDIVE